MRIPSFSGITFWRFLPRPGVAQHGNKLQLLRALRLARERLGDHVFTAESLRSLLGLYRAQGRRTEALELAREGVGMYRRLFDGDHARVAEALRVQGSLAVERAEQIGSYREAADMWARLEGEDGPQAVRLAISLARSLAADDQYAEALQLFEALAGTVPVAYGVMEGTPANTRL